MKFSIVRYIRPLVSAIALIIVLAGCNHKELDNLPQPLFRVRVVFDWHKTSAKPETRMMKVFFYNCTTGKMVYDILPAATGGYMDNLEAGEWQVTTYSYDDGTNITGEHTGSYDLHHITTREGNILEGALGNTLPPTKGGDQSVFVTPDPVWGEARASVVINPAPGQREFVVTLEPDELVCHYSYEIRNVENLSHITKMCAALSGMAGGMTLSSNLVDGESVTLPLPAYADGTNMIRGEFHTFGISPDNRDPKMMRLFVWLDDGRKLVYGTSGENLDKWNVSDQIVNAENPRRAHYIIDGLSIPTAMGGGLFDPSTDDWFTEDYEIGI